MEREGGRGRKMEREGGEKDGEREGEIWRERGGGGGEKDEERMTERWGGGKGGRHKDSFFGSVPAWPTVRWLTFHCCPLEATRHIQL